jgi:hypothetical protein
MKGFPTIHLNGTGGKALLAGYDAAYDALHAFSDEIGKIEFNSRDYYVDGPESWEAACNARVAINQKIAEIRDYITSHMMHIHNQMMHAHMHDQIK